MTWNLRDDNAILETNLTRVVACLRESSPSISLFGKSGDLAGTGVSLQIHPVDSDLPLLSKGLALGEVYVRQDDVIASYPERSPWRFGYQLDIRSVHEKDQDDVNQKGFMVLEVWLSVQTSLLDSHPEFCINIGGDSFSELGNGVWLDSKNHLALLVHPLDLEDCAISTRADLNASREIQLKVFGRFMEKGVIRRMRFRLLVANSASSQEFWIERWNEFSESPLPLTT